MKATTMKAEVAEAFETNEPLANAVRWWAEKTYGRRKIIFLYKPDCKSSKTDDDGERELGIIDTPIIPASMKVTMKIEEDEYFRYRLA